MNGGLSASVKRGVLEVQEYMRLVGQVGELHLSPVLGEDLDSADRPPVAHVGKDDMRLAVAPILAPLAD